MAVQNTTIHCENFFLNINRFQIAIYTLYYSYVTDVYLLHVEIMLSVHFPHQSFPEHFSL